MLSKIKLTVKIVCLFFCNKNVKLECNVVILSWRQGPGGAQLPGGREPPGEGGGLRAGAAHAGRHVHGARGRQVPHQVDGARGARLQHLQHQVRRVGLRHPAVGDRHVRHVALPRRRPRRRLPHAREGNHNTA